MRKLETREVGAGWRAGPELKHCSAQIAISMQERPLLKLTGVGLHSKHFL